MNLPKEFEEKMKTLLGSEYEEYTACYDEPRHYGLRVNTAKISVEDFLKIAPWPLEPVPWIENGFYYDGDHIQPSKHPYYFAGLYYLQEPSAMTPASRLPVEPGDRVLDVCAAPGGKATELGAKLQGTGILAANDLSSSRAKGLLKNLELFGIGNVLVLSEEPGKLVSYFEGYFDKILIDAPCSGEGMFRKDKKMVKAWEEHGPSFFSKIQKSIITQAAQMLRPGGRLVYSTCTFAPEEDEGSVRAFLERHPEFSVEKVKAGESFSPGRPEWTGEGGEGLGLENTFRLWPHRLEGEGHYAAVLRKAGSRDTEVPGRKAAEQKKQRPKGAEAEAWKLWKEFASENLMREPEGEAVLFGDQLFLMPCALNLAGLKVVRAGLHLGEIKKKRFEPSHALALYLRPGDVKRTYCLDAEAGERQAFLRGESFGRDAEKGWTLVLADGFPAGWGKQAGGQLKNHYPKGLRRM